MRKQFLAVTLCTTVLLLAGALASHGQSPVTRVAELRPPRAVPRIKRVVFEMSPKPFADMKDASIRRVCRDVFRQWAALIRQADSVAILLWTADGSEILQYRGREEDTIEWARYIGIPNPRQPVPRDHEKKALHSGAYLYRPDPPAITYGDLARIVRTFKQVGAEMTGKPIQVGATFDPGGEFASSPFKYQKHNEICLGGTMGQGSWVACYATLHADHESYAGFPHGIPEGTPVGTFFGRQCQHFLTDLGFDYVWFSNGFGFGMETWKTTGPLFDGQHFDASRSREIRDQILAFWKLFRAECPNLPIETRGTNLVTGSDLASNAVPLADIYSGKFNLEPPPNSPWAALDGDFGLELVGYMSRVAELPDGRGFPFRYYLHDPWWLNSPWLDRYGREPHDIYLPLSLGRINERGQVETPESVALLTIDDSFGRMPDKCPNEVIPHLLAALEDAPDRPGPLVWVYPLQEYQAMTFASSARLEEPFFGDWFMRAAVNNTLPLCTVVSSKNFLASIDAKPHAYDESILVTPAPDAGSALAETLLRHVRCGGQALLYGPLDHAGVDLLEALDLRLAEPIGGSLKIDLRLSTDRLTQGTLPDQIEHRELMSAGGCREVLREGTDRDTQIVAVVSKGASERIAALARRPAAWNGGAVAWVRGTNSASYRGGHLLAPDDPKQWFQGELLMRSALAALGSRIALVKHRPEQRNPVLSIARHDNGFFFSGCTPDTTVELRLLLPQGAPVLTGMEADFIEGQAAYRMPRAWHRECRVFVKQPQGVVSCVEQTAEEIGLHRRLRLEGLEDAAVCFYPERLGKVTFQPHPQYPFLEGPFLDAKTHDDRLGHRLTAEHVTGTLLISW